MYSFDWNAKTGGYVLNTKSARFVASEIRPVFAEELKLVGFDAHFKFDANETRPICWAKQNLYLTRSTNWSITSSAWGESPFIFMESCLCLFGSMTSSSKKSFGEIFRYSQM